MTVKVKVLTGVTMLVEFSGFGDGYYNGDGDGYGHGNGHGYGNGCGYGGGYGYGYGNGGGYGYGDGCFGTGNTFVGYGKDTDRSSYVS